MILPDTSGWPDLDLLETAPILIWRAGIDGACNWFNSAWLAYRGRTMAQEQGNGWATGVHPDDLDRCLGIYTVAFAKRARFDMEYRILRADGSYGWIVDYGVPVKDRDGGFLGYVGYCFDVTDRKAGEAAIAAKENELRTIYDASSVSIFHLGTDGRITQANRRMAEMFACTIDDLIGSPYHARLHSSCRDAAENNLVELLDSRGLLDVKRIYVRADMTEFWGRLTIERRLDTTGHIIGFVGVIVDITDQKTAESQLEKTLTDLVASNADLETFAYAASHDLREPLRMISSYISLIERRYKPLFDADGVEFLGYIREGAQRMDQMVLGLLAYSRIDRTGDPIARMRPSDALTMALDNLRLVIRENQATFQGDLTDAPVVMGDALQITRLFQNILENALKYRSKDVPPHLTIGWTRQDSLVEFRIQDNGIGIQPDFFGKIFNLFQRLHSRHDYDGNGIGLAVCKKIVERHRGTIRVESQLGQGACFIFTLVAADVPLADTLFGQ